MSGKRTFTVESSSHGHTGGRYCTDGPGRAARHAARILLSKSGEKSVTFRIRETTRGSNHKEYSYKAHLEKRAEPKKWTINGVERTSKHEIVVHAD